jgi:GNAT superfamily N-acetyltransferase
MMPEVRIRSMDQDEDFAAWLTELLEREADEAGMPSGFDDRYIGLSDEIGDWIGGLRYYVRGGVAHLLDLVVSESYRGQGHAHRLLAAFEERVGLEGAHLAEFWTDDERAEGLLGAMGWNLVIRRPRYMNERSWTLLEKRLPQ